MSRVLTKKGRIIITDLMFANAKSRKEFEENRTLSEKKDLEDEYFGQVDEIEKVLKEHRYNCIRKQIVDLIWMIVGDRK